MSPRELVQLRDVSTIVRKTIAPERIPDGTTYVGLENIERGGALLNITSVSRGDLASAKFEFTSDQVLFGKLRPYLAKIARPTFGGVCSTDILPITPGPRLDKNYLAHYLLTPDVVARAAARATGANLPRLSPGELANFQIPLPPIKEQRRIAAILDQADALRVKRHEALAHLDDLSRSIFLEMFGDALRATKWPTLQLREAVKEGTLVTYGIVQAGDEYPEGVPYIRTGDISNGQIDVVRLRRTDPQIARRFDRSRVETGDIVMSIRATVGTTAMVPQEIDGANLTQGTARIAPGARTLGVYLLHYLRSLDVQQWIQRQVKGATFLEITLSRLRELVVAVPPLDQQERFALRLAAVDGLAAQSSTQGQALDSLFASLHSRAFAGHL